MGNLRAKSRAEPSLCEEWTANNRSCLGETLLLAIRVVKTRGVDLWEFICGRAALLLILLATSVALIINMEDLDKS